MQVGITLTVEPGVTVLFAHNIGMLVNGTLIARGTAQLPILLTSASIIPGAGDWASVGFGGSAVGATYDGSGHYLAGSILEYTSVLYAGGNGATAALKIGTSAPYVHNVTIEYSAAEGLYANGPTNLLMDGVTIANNAATGVQMDGEHHRPAEQLAHHQRRRRRAAERRHAHRPEHHRGPQHRHRHRHHRQRHGQRPLLHRPEQRR